MAEPGFKQEDDLVIVSVKVPAGTKNRSIEVKFTEASVQAGLQGAPPLLQVGLLRDSIHVYFFFVFTFSIRSFHLFTFYLLLLG